MPASGTKYETAKGVHEMRRLVIGLEEELAEANQAINADAISPSGVMIHQITMPFPIGVGGASLNRNS